MPTQPRAPIHELRASLAGSFIASSLVISPLALLGFWMLGRYTQTLFEDQQMKLFFGGLLPFAVGCVFTTLAVHRRLHLRVISNESQVVARLLAVILVWPMMVCATIATAPLPLPMIDERTPSTLKYWTIFSIGWILLIIACGLYLQVTARLEGTRQTKS